MKRLSRHARVVAVLAILLATLALSLPSSAQEPVTIAFWSRDSAAALVQSLADAWNASHDNQIEVTLIPAAEYITKLGTAIAAGEPPDLLAIDLIYVPQFAAAGQLTEISELAAGLPFFDTLSPSHIRLATYEDGLYALPFNAEASVLLYNKDLFRQAGLDPEQPPTNWQEIYDAAVAISALGEDIDGFYFSGACAGCNAFTFLPLIWASGGDVLNEDATEATLTDPMVKAALEFYHQMWTEGLMPETALVDAGAEFLSAFFSGKIGMMGSGAFSISTLKNEHPEIDFGITFLPGKEGGVSSFAGGDSIGIPAGSKYPEEAFEFIEWVLSDEVQLEMFARTASLPVRTDLAENKYFEEDPRLTTNAQAMALGRTPYSLVYNQLFNDSNGPWLAMIQQAVFDGQIDEAIAYAQQQFTEIMAQVQD
ncbi:MAG: sugar ABC transporter substrate-binding protein [Anaerolineae bacterium]|nr:sugar ABC transporter substrate-binding protein [Anaerolineae bacterium]